MTDTSATSTAASRELPFPSGATLDIYLTSGSVHLRGTDDDRVVVRAQDGEPLGDEIRVEAEPDIVRVRDAEGSWKLGPFSVSTRRSRDLAIDLPRTAAVVLRTLSGDVQASGIGADSRWASASGDLRISVDGGRVQLETMSGDAILEASGTITLGARTVSGDLRIHAPRIDAVDASTTSGDVRIEGDLGRGTNHTINSVSGDVELVTGSPVRLQVETIAGDVHASGRHQSDGAPGHRTLVVGDGSVAVSVRTTSGDVRLRALEGGTGAIAPEPAEPAVAPEPPTAPVAPTAADRARAPGAPDGRRRWRAAAPPDRRGGGHAGVERRRPHRRPPRGRSPRGPAGPRARGARHRDCQPPPRVPRAGRPALLPGVVLMAVDPLDQVLRLVAEGRLTAEEAAPILAALDEPPAGIGPAPARGGADRASGGAPDSAPSAPSGQPGRTADRSIRLEVREHGRSVVNLRLPLAVGRLALDRIPGLSGEQAERVREALASGMRGPIFEVDDDGENTVRIVVE